MTDYTDLKARLRDARAKAPMQGSYTGLDGKPLNVAVMQPDPLAAEALAAIEALEAEVARLREELSLIAVMGYGANAAEHDAIARLAVQRARAAITAPTSGC